MKRFAAMLSLLLAVGCGSVISEGVRGEMDRNASITAIQADPNGSVGRKVLWGGKIISVKNLEKTTHIEVLQTKLDFTDRPTGQGSTGRFIIEVPGFADTLIYTPDKNVTVAGVIKGIANKKIGQMNYPYPIVEPLEMKLLEPTPEYSDYPPPAWWYDPFYDPLFYDPFYYGPYRPGHGPYGRWPYGGGGYRGYPYRSPYFHKK